jgi:hypothetical protein
MGSRSPIFENPAADAATHDGILRPPLAALRYTLSRRPKMLPFLAVFLFVAGAPARRVTADGDPLMHAVVGREIVALHGIPASDPFLVPLPGHGPPPFVDTEWAWDVLAYGVFDPFGFPGLVMLCATLAATTFALLFALLERRCGPTLALALLFVLLIASDMHLACRPHLVTWLGIAVGMWLVERSSRWWAFSLLAAIWVNFHGGAFVGALALAAYAGWRHRAVGAALRVLAPMAAGLLVNPEGPGAALQVATILTDFHTLARTSDFGAVWSAGSVALPSFALLAGLSAFALAVGGDWFGLGWAALLLAVAAESGRNVPVAALLLGPAIAEWFARGLARVPSLREAFESLDRRFASVRNWWWVAAAAPVLLVLVVGLAVSPPDPLGLHTVDVDQPVVDSVEAPWLLWNRPGRRVLIYPLTGNFPSEAAERMDRYLAWKAGEGR